MNRTKRALKILSLATVTCLLGTYLFGSADAQREPGREGGPPGGFRGFDPEQMEKVWVLQAEGVASALGFDEAATGKLSETYKQSRQQFHDKMMEARESGGGWEGFREIREEAAEGLKTSLGEALTADQAEKAYEFLGGLSFRADIGTNALMEIVEDESKLKTAVGILMKIEGNQPFSRDQREEREARREKLYQELGSVLSPEQIEKFKGSFERFGRRGPRGEGDRPDREPESE